MSIATSVLENAGQPHHYVHFGIDDHDLLKNVAIYAAKALSSDGAALVVATAGHTAGLRAELAKHRENIEADISQGALVFFDAEETLGRILSGGYPDASQFDKIVGTAVRGLVGRSAGPLHAYGEMVALLWNAKQYPAAIRLEQLWNRLRGTVPFSLYCSYSIDIFGPTFQTGVVDALLSAHTHLLPAPTNARLVNALRTAMDEMAVDTTGLWPNSDGKPSTRCQIAEGEALILSLRERVPREADAILERARQHFYAISA